MNTVFDGSPDLARSSGLDTDSPAENGFCIGAGHLSVELSSDFQRDLGTVWSPTEQRLKVNVDKLGRISSPIADCPPKSRSILFWMRCYCIPFALLLSGPSSCTPRVSHAFSSDK